MVIEGEEWINLIADPYSMCKMPLQKEKTFKTWKNTLFDIGTILLKQKQKTLLTSYSYTEIYSNIDASTVVVPMEAHIIPN